MTDGTAGMENQCVGLAERVGLPFVVRRLAPRAPWRWLPPTLWPAPLTALVRAGDRLEPPWPRLLIGSGRLSVAPALAVARASAGRTFTVQIQNPQVPPGRFGLVVAPEHDRLAGSNVVATMGSLHGVTMAKLDAARVAFADTVAALPRPRVAVLVGGANRAYRFGAADARGLGARLGRMARETGGGLMVTPSRRTGARPMTALTSVLREVPAIVWNGREPNPYLGFLAHADAVVVTADSVNMATEALATGKPVHVAALPGGSAKFRRFHDALVERGYTRPFRGTLEAWSYAPLDETGRVAAFVRAHLGLDQPGVALSPLAL